MLNASVSSESIEVPEYQPATDSFPEINGGTGTSRGSGGAPMTISFPFAPSPPIVEVIALLSVTVARITFAPPIFVSSDATS